MIEDNAIINTSMFIHKLKDNDNETLCTYVLCILCIVCVLYKIIYIGYFVLKLWLLEIFVNFDEIPNIKGLLILSDCSETLSFYTNCSSWSHQFRHHLKKIFLAKTCRVRIYLTYIVLVIHSNKYL